MRVVLLSLVALGVFAQSAQERAIAKQRASIQGQSVSVRKQLRQTNAPSDGFFMVSWAAPQTTAAAAPVAAAELDCEKLPATSLDPIIEANAAQTGITPDVLRAVIRRESANNPCAVSRKGAMGLMQLMPGTATEMSLYDAFDPAENVRAGSQYLKQLLDRYGGDLMLALSAYNAGPARVDAIKAIPPIRETRDYVRAILGDVTASGKLDPPSLRAFD